MRSFRSRYYSPTFAIVHSFLPSRTPDRIAVTPHLVKTTQLSTDRCLLAPTDGSTSTYLSSPPGLKTRENGSPTTAQRADSQDTVEK